MKKYICTKYPSRKLIRSSSDTNMKLAKSIVNDIVDYLESRTQWSKTFKIQSLTRGSQYDDTLEYDYTIVDDDGIKIEDSVYLARDSDGVWYDPRETYDYSDAFSQLWEDYATKADIDVSYYEDDEW